MSQHTLSVRDGAILMDGNRFLVKGLRCSNALISDGTADQLVENLDGFRSFGVNTVAVYFMGSRFGDVAGYNEDASLSADHAARMARIIRAADQRRMAVLVGCLYWGETRARWASWTQAEANAAVQNTIEWLAADDLRNVFLDVDNEGMALRAAGFDNRAMLLAGKEVGAGILIGTNYRGNPPPEADVVMHHSNEAPGVPYIESEGSPPSGMPTPGGYWGEYSKAPGLYGYLNIGIYTEAMKESQKAATREHLRTGRGYMLASTWLQAAPPQGPNQRPGGVGSPGDPGVRWWLEFLRDELGEYN